MLLGALVDAGVPARLFEETVSGLNIGGRLEISRVNRGGISATKVDVYAHGEKDLPREQYWEQQRAAKSRPTRSQGHDPVQFLEHNYAMQEASGPHEHKRGLRQIREIIEKAVISESAKATALAVFQALGEAEAKIHNISADEVHFHEVGAIDAIIDIVCAAVGLDSLGVDEIISSSLNVGGGTVDCAHGTFPVPAPATFELLKGAPVYSSGINAELVTPTGAAIVKAVARRFAPFPKMKVEKIGYGAGTREFAEQPNVLRLAIGETQNVCRVREETVTVLEANVDDSNPQILGYVMECLLEKGALDVFVMPVQMKKNRPGFLLTTLCKPEHAAEMCDLIFRETTTLGVRRRQERRQVLARKWVSVATPWGDVRVKVASINGTITNYAPEYEDCRRIASEQHVALKTVMQEALDRYLQSKNNN